MSWRSARESANLLAERLKKLDRPAAPASRPAVAEPVFVKPSRRPLPPADAATGAIDAELADIDLIERERADDTVDEADETPEARRAPRKSQTLPAYVTGAGMTSIIPARVIDMSATGAKIELTPMGRSTGIPMTHLPDRFVLVLRYDKMEVDCETVWRKEWFVGVRFLGFPRPQIDAGRR